MWKQADTERGDRRFMRVVDHLAITSFKVTFRDHDLPFIVTSVTHSFVFLRAILLSGAPTFRIHCPQQESKLNLRIPSESDGLTLDQPFVALELRFFRLFAIDRP